VSKPEFRRVAVLGLGIIGAQIAERLVTEIPKLTVWNRTPGRNDELALLGADIAATASDAVLGADLVITAVTDGRAMSQLLLDSNTVVDALKPGAIVVDVSTVPTGLAREIAERLCAMDVAFLDSPIIGRTSARTGMLSLVCGGAEEAFERVRPLLGRFAAKAVYVGDSGAGQTAKAINQVILAGTLAGVAEGLAIAEASGLDTTNIVEALKDGGAASWVLTNKAPLMLRRDLEPGGRLSLHEKDLDIALDLARSLGLELRVATEVRAMERRLIDTGYGDEDISALVRAFDRVTER
jgi:3-hydroxyisobutyrate dehydrogenase-like beta-hydroxyacid dehydrogenase